MKNHLLYFDITQFCNINCDFCMYRDRHSSLKMNINKCASENIRRLFLDADIKRISISGEGEPLTNMETIWDIIELSPGKLNFEIITSGALPHAKMANFYSDMDHVTSKKGDLCNIRISADSFHAQRVPFRAHGFSIKYFSESVSDCMTLSFRSIETDKIFTREFLIQEARKYKLDGIIEPINELEDVFICNNKQYSIIYKNIVHPNENQNGHMTLDDYIKVLENKYGKSFTFGAMNHHPTPNGLDVTIKPDGRILFYGIEIVEVANIYKDNIDMFFLKNFINKNKLISILYKTPFTEILRILRKRIDYHEIIKNANNPYWVLQDLKKYNPNFIKDLMND